MEKRVTISDVAAQTGFSKTIISNYLNQKYETMTPETRERIRAEIERLGYVPNSRYRNYKIKKTGLIGLILSDITDPFCNLICKGITDAAWQCGYSILLGNSDNNVMTENQYIESFQELADGLIIVSVGKNDETLLGLENKIPVVLLDRRIRVHKYDVVCSDNYEAMQKLLSYLSSVGYETFGLFTEELIEGTGRLIRHNSFNDYMKAKGLESNAYVYPVNLYDEKVMMGSLIDFVEKVKGTKTVIICVNGRTLTHVLGGMHSLNLKIPDDVGICGYDDFEAIELLHNGVTSIRQPTYELACRCVEQIVKRINQEGNPEPMEIILSSKLIIRSSV